jgi:hypothetical protein
MTRDGEAGKTGSCSPGSGEKGVAAGSAQPAQKPSGTRRPVSTYNPSSDCYRFGHISVARRVALWEYERGMRVAGVGLENFEGQIEAIAFKLVDRMLFP